MTPVSRTFLALVGLSLCPLPSGVRAQVPPTGLEVGALPAINFDSDEGFGYGALAELYQYGPGGLAPYVWSLRPTLFLTTGGRRDYTVFFDAPHLLPGGLRLDAFVGSERQIATPFYGVGNGSAYDPALEADEGPDPFYYRFGRTRLSATFNLQRHVGDLPVRWLVGAGAVRTRVTPVPEADGATLYARSVADSTTRAWSNYLRAGLVWDTRDREAAPRRGTWTELLVQRVDERLGADASYTRWTFTDRRYVSLGPTVVFAHRLLLQGVTDGARVEDLFQVQTSFRQQEGLGGAKTVRGILRNRYVGRSMMVWNAELRWRAADFRMLGRPFHVVVSAFLDQGRVWAEGVEPGEVFTDLHRGWGSGLRLGMGENFVVALDVGRSAEAGTPIYVGLGYLY